MTTPSTPATPRSRTPLTIAAAAVLLALGAGAIWYFTHERGAEITEDA